MTEMDLSVCDCVEGMKGLPDDSIYLPEDQTRPPTPWAGILIDPPYSEGDADHYMPGADKYPKPNQLIRHALDVLPPGGRVGIIHFILPSPPKDVRFVAAVGVLCGYNNRCRIYSVFEKPSL